MSCGRKLTVFCQNKEAGVFLFDERGPNMRTTITVVLALIVFCSSALVSAEMTVGLDWEMINRENTIAAWVDGELGGGFGIKLGVGASGSMEGPDEFTTFVEEFGGSYSIGAFTVFGGLLRHSFGRAQVHPTFLGAQGPAFPNVGYAVEGANWSYVKLLGDVRTPRRALTPGEGQEEFKRLGLHYLRLTPWEPLTISVGEAFVYTAPFDGDIFYNTLPILPYYFAKYLPGIKTAIDNSLFYGDAILRLPQAALYGELLVNEFPMVPGATNPRLFAVTLGVQAELVPSWDVLAEYTYVTESAYSNKNPDAAYSVGDKPLGNPLGDDLMGVDLQVSHYWEALATDTTVGVYHLRLGNTVVRPWKSEEVVSEKVYGIKLEAKHQLNNLELKGHLDVGYVQDYKHQPGETGIRQKLVLSATWYL
jgi:hypothetical protein